MPTRNPGPFVILRARLLDRALWFEYLDSRSETRTPEKDGYIQIAVSGAATQGWPGAPAVCVPFDLGDLLQAMVAEAPLHQQSYKGPVAVPVFAAKEPIHQQISDVAYQLWEQRGRPYGSPEIDWFQAQAQIGATEQDWSFDPENLVESLPAVAGWADVEVVRLARDSWEPRSPFELPLILQPVGDEAAQALAVIASHSWYQQDPDVQEFGLVLASPIAPGQVCGAIPPDIVACASQDFAGVLNAVWIAPLTKRPRLILVLGDIAVASSEPLPEGISLLVIPVAPPFAATFLNQFLYGIIHDNPLHSSLKLAMWALPSINADRPLLISDPAAIHDLRLKDALSTIVHEALQLRSAPLAEVELAWFADIPKSDELNEALSISSQAGKVAQSAIDQVLSLKADFTQETLGLVPISRARKALLHARQLRLSVKPHFETLAADAAVVSALAAKQERRVDIALLRTEPGDSFNLFVQPGEPLQTGSHYQLRVQIGQKSPHTLIIEETPPIDPILPETDPARGHYLHIVLFPLDFQCFSANMFRVFLPQYSSSEAVIFEVSAPSKPGPVRLRVGIYYDLPGGVAANTPFAKYWNHLLQMFLLEGTVNFPGSVATSNDVSLQVRLEFSRTSRFVNLDELSPRCLSIAVNEDPQGTHRLMVKGGIVNQDVRWTEAALNVALTRVRQLLENMTWTDNKNGPRFPHDPPVKPRAEFEVWIKKLASAGKALYDGLWVECREDFQDALRQVSNTSDGVIQIVRLATNFLFPWSALYDFDVPSEKPGEPPAEVCAGFTRPGYNCRKCLEECLHPDKSEVYCVYGFWGNRHQVEQLLHTPFQKEDAITVIRPMPAQAVSVSVGIKGNYMDKVVETLQKVLGDQAVYPVQSLKETLARLWSEKDRPAILLILGHYESPQPDKPQITFAGNGWLQPSDITRMVQKLAKWTGPNPVIVLAACETAAASLDSITSFLSAFADARASAVIGTETTVFEGLACRFAQEIATLLMQPSRRTLGDAVLQFRRELLLDFNPLGLVFTPYGDAGLHRI